MHAVGILKCVHPLQNLHKPGEDEKWIFGKRLIFSLRISQFEKSLMWEVYKSLFKGSFRIHEPLHMLVARVLQTQSPTNGHCSLRNPIIEIRGHYIYGLQWPLAQQGSHMIWRTVSQEGNASLPCVAADWARMVLLLFHCPFCTTPSIFELFKMRAALNLCEVSAHLETWPTHMPACSIMGSQGTAANCNLHAFPTQALETHWGAHWAAILLVQPRRTAGTQPEVPAGF